jgi:5-methyltetrahydrofolate--homocysteine methyltransferase
MFFDCARVNMGSQMPQSILHELFASRDWLLADGATGTNYFAMGLQSGDAPELWNISHPERVASLHNSFIEAGADIILTNSFGGSSYRLKLHQAQDRVTELNLAAASIARNEADKANRPIIVAGSVGPTGEILQPIGILDPAAAEDAFAAQALALAEGGADVIWLETMSSKEELKSAGAGAKRTGLPVVATMTFDTNGSTMMGFSPQELVELYRETVPQLAAYGANCGVGASDLIGAMIAMRNRADSGDILIAKSNCGIPEFTDGKIQYSGTPELMADYARLARDVGARIIGGCCGTTPDHLLAMRNALDVYQPQSTPELDDVVNRLGSVTAGTRAFCVGQPLGSNQSNRPKRGRRRVR